MICGSDLVVGIVVFGGYFDLIVGCMMENMCLFGVDDDVLGIVSLIEVLCVLFVNNYWLKWMIKFVGYVVEEVGLFGLKVIVK